MRYLNYIKGKEDSFEVTGGVPDSIITEAEDKLQIKFPVEYKVYLSELGSLSSGDTFVYGLYKNYDNEKTTGSVLYETLRCRNLYQLPDTYIVLEHEEDENIYVPLVTKDDNIKDSAIFSMDIDVNQYLSSPTKIYDTFVDYLQEFIDLNE